MTHICIGKLTAIVSDHGLSPSRHQVIIWTNAGILILDPWEQPSVKSTLYIFVQENAFEMSSGQWWPFFAASNMLTLKPENWLRIHLFCLWFMVLRQESSERTWYISWRLLCWCITSADHLDISWLCRINGPLSSWCEQPGRCKPMYIECESIVDGLFNGLRLAINWTNGNLFYWRIYASPGLHALKPLLVAFM